MTNATANSYDEWVRQAGDAEVSHDITVGTRNSGMRASDTIHSAAMRLKALGKLVELKRRDAGLSIDELAEKACVSVDDLLKLEWGHGNGIGSDVVNAIAKALALPTARIFSMLGTVDAGTQSLQDAALRFTARAAGFDALKPIEREALSEFIGILEASH